MSHTIEAARSSGQMQGHKARRTFVGRAAPSPMRASRSQSTSSVRPKIRACAVCHSWCAEGFQRKPPGAWHLQACERKRNVGVLGECRESAYVQHTDSTTTHGEQRAIRRRPARNGFSHRPASRSHRRTKNAAIELATNKRRPAGFSQALSSALVRNAASFITITARAGASSCPSTRIRVIVEKPLRRWRCAVVAALQDASTCIIATWQMRPERWLIANRE